LTDSGTVLEIDEKIAAALCYPLGWVSGLILWSVQRHNQYVRFHALQSLIAFFALFLATIILGSIPLIGSLVSAMGYPLSFVLAVFMMHRAYSGVRYKLPLVGEFAQRHVQSSDSRINCPGQKDV